MTDTHTPTIVSVTGGDTRRVPAIGNLLEDGRGSRDLRRPAADRQRLARRRHLEPHVLIGATGAPGTFTREAIEAMSTLNDRPMIFALSNPTSQAECTAEQAYRWSEGRAIFTSGSPFDPVEIDGHRFEPAQGNNVHIFPGVGLGVWASSARGVSDAMFLAAARALADSVRTERLERGAIYPALTEARRVSAAIAAAVAERAYDAGLAVSPRPADLDAHIASLVYDPSYDDPQPTPR